MDSIAMAFDAPHRPLRRTLVASRAPGTGQVVVRVRACGVCRTDLHIVDGELPNPKPHVIPGHEIVGVVEERGAGVALPIGARVGVPWLAHTCGRCRFCMRAQENLCERATFTGYTVDGGFAERVTAFADYCFPIPSGYADAEAAPLLCAGLIGHRAWRMIPPGAERIGLYGFGSAAHLLAQLARHEGRSVYAFTRPDDLAGQRFARELGAAWAGGSNERAPETLDAAILFAPVGALIPTALAAVDRGGVVVCAGIHMSDVPSFPYALLWGERVVRSVANLTRSDGTDFFHAIERAPIRAVVRQYALADANAALADLREGRVEGTAVLVP